jgi:RNA polymerase sigma factor (TIGR02999 family)
MNDENSHEITALLQAWGNGDQDAYERLAGLVYGELHRIAQCQLQREHNGHTLNPSALVNETFLKLNHCQQMQWQDRQHFYNLVARLMRQVLVNYANAHNRQKRWGRAQQVTLTEPLSNRQDGENKVVDLLALDEALTRLEQKHARCAQVAELRYFFGLTELELASVLQVSERTVKRDWRFAQAWLQHELSR